MKQGFTTSFSRVTELDGCFFKGACQGELLVAISRDAMYPISWAVVEKETTETWKWFICLLIKDFDINEHGEGFRF